MGGRARGGCLGLGIALAASAVLTGATATVVVRAERTLAFHVPAGASVVALDEEGTLFAAAPDASFPTLLRLPSGRAVDTELSSGRDAYAAALPEPGGGFLAVREWTVERLGSDGSPRRLLRTLRVVCAARSRGGRYLLVGRENAEPELYRIDVGGVASVWLGVPESRTQAVAFDRSGRFWIAHPDGRISARAVPSGQWLAELRLTMPLEAPLALAPEAGLVVRAQSGDIALVSLATGEVVRRLGLEKPVQSVAVSPEEELLAVGEGDGVVQVFRLPAGRRVARFACGTNAVVGLAFAPGLERLAAVASDGEVRVWSLRAARRAG